jgi:hypothetical protein
MELVYVDEPSILLLLDEGLNIVHAQRVRRNKQLPPCIIRLAGLHSTSHRQPAIRDDHFETDGLGCIRLLLWITLERPDASTKANFNRFERLFSDNPTDAITATLRILTGQEARAAGETAYFIAQQWRHHPAEMAAIKALGSMG